MTTFFKGFIISWLLFCSAVVVAEIYCF